MPQSAPSRGTTVVGAAVLALGILGTSAGFLLTVRDYRLLPSPDGIVWVLGVPVGAFTLTLGVLTLVMAMAILARRRALERDVPRDYSLGLSLLLFGVIGWYAAYALAADKVLLLLEPTTELGCNVSLLVQCGANLDSWQGSVFGFPNPLIGIAGWAAVFMVGCLVLAGIRFAPWFWVAFASGVAGALAFVLWLIGQSVFVLGTLCPWCLVTWAVTIPLFFTVTLHSARDGHFGRRAAIILSPAYSWVPLITVGSYIVVAAVAQARLDVLAYL